MVAGGTRTEDPAAALMVTEGRESKTKKNRFGGTVKFAGISEEIPAQVDTAAMTCGHGRRPPNRPFFA